MPFDPRDQNDRALVESRYTDCVYCVTLGEYTLPNAEWMRTVIKGRWHSLPRKTTVPLQSPAHQFCFDNEQDAVLFGLKYS